MTWLGKQFKIVEIMQNNPVLAPSTVFSVLLNSELIRWIVIEVVQIWKEQRFEGTYIVDQHTSSLELCDPQGYIAVYNKCQDITFAQTGIFAIQDQAWGDGDIFSDYTCSPGIAVDRYEEGHRWKTLISLRATKRKGQKEKIQISRTTKNGYLAIVNNFSVHVDHPTKQLLLSLIFPKERPPQSIVFLEQNTKLSVVLNDNHKNSISFGRIQYSYLVEKPRLFEEYSLRWEW